MPLPRRLRLLIALLAVSIGFTVSSHAWAATDAARAWTMIVMDPLAKPLSCPCVQGYAQRDYTKLAVYLEKTLGVPVRVAFHESLKTALTKETDGQAHLIIGKRSVIVHDLQHNQLAGRSVARLTDQKGRTTMTGLIVVPAHDSAKSISDLSGYRIVFGPEECDEKHAAALQLLQDHGVNAPRELETSPACSEGAIAVLEDAKQGLHGAAVISSYAKPLLEGCGTVEKGSLRLLGETKEVPFIEAFVTSQLSDIEQSKLTSALLGAIAKDGALREALETRDGFVASPADERLAKKNNP